MNIHLSPMIFFCTFSRHALLVVFVLSLPLCLSSSSPICSCRPGSDSGSADKQPSAKHSARCPPSAFYHSPPDGCALFHFATRLPTPIIGSQGHPSRRKAISRCQGVRNLYTFNRLRTPPFKWPLIFNDLQNRPCATCQLFAGYAHLGSPLHDIIQGFSKRNPG